MIQATQKPGIYPAEMGFIVIIWQTQAKRAVQDDGIDNILQIIVLTGHRLA